MSVCTCTGLHRADCYWCSVADFPVRAVPCLRYYLYMNWLWQLEPAFLTSASAALYIRWLVFLMGIHPGMCWIVPYISTTSSGHHHPVTWCYVIWPTDSIIKKATNPTRYPILAYFPYFEKIREVRGWTSLLSLIRHGPHWKRCVQQFCCCMCIWYQGNVSTEPLPNNDRGIFNEPLPSDDKGYTDWWEGFLVYFPYFENIKVCLWDHVAVCVTRPIVARQRLGKGTLSLLGNGLVKIPLSSLGIGSVGTLPQ
jgi:hypothetical protein